MRASRLFGLGGDLHRVALELLVRYHDDRRHAARSPRHEQQAIDIWRQLDLNLAREIEQFFGDLRFFQRAIPGGVIEDLDQLFRLSKRPR